MTDFVNLRGIAIASAVSAAVHALALGYGRIALPERPPQLPPLTVEVVRSTPPALSPPPARTRSAARAVRARPATATAVLPPFAATAESDEADIERSEEMAVAPESQPAEPAVAATAPVTTLDAPAAPVLPPFPRSGRITYTLVYGRDQFPVGRTVQTWKIEGARYQLASRSETTGVIDLVRPQHRTYFSRGELTPAGLRPEVFLMSRDRGRGIEEARAQFDWSNATVRLGSASAQRDEALPPQAQDLLSFIYQLALDPPRVGRTELAITNGKRLDVYALDVLPEENIETPVGVLRTLPIRQIRRPGAEGVDVWLATEYRHLPVRVRFYGRDGEAAGEQIVSEIRLSDE